MPSKRLLWAGLVAAAAMAAGGLLLWRGREKPAPAAAAPALEPPPSQVTLSGRIQAQQIVPVGPAVEGHIEEFLVDVGQEVFEGQLLARIKNPGLETAQQAATADLERIDAKVRALESGLIAARLEASRARADAGRVRGEFEAAERSFLRQEMLLKEGATARLTFEKAQREYTTSRMELEAVDELARQAEGRLGAIQKELEAARRMLEEKTQALDEAKENLAATEVHSPVDGVVVGRAKQPGDPVGPEVRDLVQIAVELSTLEVVVEPEPPALARIRPGSPALVELPEGPIGGMTGQVREVKGDKVIVEFANPNPQVRPGLTAQVRIKLEPVPAKAAPAQPAKPGD